MTVAPAITWTCLFPSDASYVCDETGPGWLLDSLRPLQGHARRVRVSVGAPAAAPGQADHFDGHVVINPNRGSEQFLRQAGYPYIRHFAALPSLQHARWFVPLGKGAISAGSLNLYTPARASARIKQLAAKAIARTGLPVWYRDHVLIAARELPPIERTVRAIFDGTTDMRLALSAGAPEPARNRKPSLAVLNGHGEITALVKIGNSPLSRQIAGHEASVLAEFKNLPELTSRVPRLYYADEVDGQFLLIQSALPGKPAPAALTPAHHDFLNALRRGPVKPATQTAMIRALQERLASLPNDLALATILDEIRPTLHSLRVPSTIVHGDFAPWNLRRHRGAISAFDWEYAQLDGLPLIDETHFRLQVGYLIHNFSDERAARELHVAARAAAPTIVMTQQAIALQSVYLLDMLARLLHEGYDPADEMLAWYRRVLHRLVPGRREVAAA